MWLFVLNGLAYLIYGLATGRFRRMLVPIRWTELVATIKESLRLHLAHDDLTQYNAVQKLLYIRRDCVGVVTVLSGLAIWKPVQFSELAALFGSFQNARLVHFLCMAAIVVFVVVHVTLALLVPRTPGRHDHRRTDVDEPSKNDHRRLSAGAEHNWPAECVERAMTIRPPSPIDLSTE